jgi:hypothetical protein
MTELPQLGRCAPRTTLVTITSLRALQRLVACSLLVSVLSLSLLCWRLP